LVLKDEILGLAPGTVLSESYIESLPDEEHKEQVHQLNRRTEFKIIGFTKDASESEKEVLEELHKDLH
jgi:hypothetical protein